ncbi:jasmonate-induced protein [Carex littledalei]|uniref:Dirigent protein n=1 Tax=Carex littledalei TaxID=544730 RepID=A0A833VMH3_9POAL|nr:jasmonate-induced protein [Carex littledalei]
MTKSTFNIAPVSALQKNELYFHMYLHHTPLGSNRNQSGIVNPNLPNSFGWTVVNDWPLYDALGPNAKVIARAQGLHIQTGMSSQKYQNYLSIVFEDARFKGSTLQVMGPVVEGGEWAIVGGTGEFPMARGVIYKKFHEQKKDGNIMELDIHAFYSAVRPWSLGV